MKVVVLLFGLLFAQLGFAEESARAASDYVYTVKTGDTLIRLSNELLDSPKRWQEVSRYNHLANSNRIEPGQVLRIQRPWLKTRAGTLKVEAVSGAAFSAGRAIKVGDEIPVGAELKTDAGGALRLRLPDGSLINMLEASQLQVEKLEQGQEGRFASLFRLVTGQIEAFKKKHEAGVADMEIKTKVVTMGVRGTHFRMRQEGGRAYAEIEEGLVGYEALNTPVVLALAGGHGSVADGVHAAEVIELLPQPAFPQLPTEFDTPYIQWMMPELAGAQGFVGELARDEEFSDHLVSVRVQGKKLILKELANGKYWLRLRGIDGHGLQGREAKVSFAVNAPARKFRMTKVYVSANGVQLRWVGRKEGVGYQVQIADNQKFDKPMIDVKTADNLVDIARPKSGQYFMRVRQVFEGGITDTWDAPMMFETPK